MGNISLNCFSRALFIYGMYSGNKKSPMTLISTSDQSMYVLIENVYHIQQWWLSILPVFVRTTPVVKKKKIKSRLIVKINYSRLAIVQEIFHVGQQTMFPLFFTHTRTHTHTHTPKLKSKSHHSEKQSLMLNPPLSTSKLSEKSAKSYSEATSMNI